MADFASADGEGNPFYDRDAWAYRIFYRDPNTGLYMSPYVGQDKAVGVAPGDKVTSGPVEDRGRAEPTIDTIMKGMKSFSPGHFMEYVSDPWSTGYSELANVIGGMTDLGTGHVINAGAGPYFARMIHNYAPNVGFSVLGMPRDGYSIIRGVDVGGSGGGFKKMSPEKIDDMIRKAETLDDLVRAHYEANGNFLESAIADDFFGSGLYKDNERPLRRAAIRAGVPKMELDLGAITLGDIVDMLAQSELDQYKTYGGKKRNIGSEDAENDLRSILAEESVNYIPAGKDFFKDPREKFKDAMHDRLVDSMLTTLGTSHATGAAFGDRDRANADNYRLVQVAAPVSALLHNDNVLRGNIKGERDFMNELILNQFELPTENGKPLDLGSYDELSRKGGPIWNYYAYRLKGMPGEEAWSKAMGKRWGDLKYILSDGEMKEICDGLKGFVEDRLRQGTIAAALTRRPGNG